jgi:hypothetical protein
MGDRCYLRVSVFRPHAEKFRTAVDGVVEVKDDGVNFMTLQDESSDYGSHDALISAAKSGLVFSGFHTAGDEYGGRKFVAAHGRIHFVSVHNDVIVVPVGPHGQVHWTDMRDAQEYLRVSKFVNRLLDTPVVISAALAKKFLLPRSANEE